jgi:hypothetical protein
MNGINSIKTLLVIILIIAIGFIGLPWLFNHLDPWVAILGGIFYIYGVYKLIINYLNK